MTDNTFTLNTLGIMHTPFKEKFAIPRQPRLVPEAIGILELLPPYNDPNFVQSLSQFSHLWILFMFHQNLDKGFTPTIRPPRLGGNKKVGVFASRSTFRPNGIGMSAVKLLGIEQNQGVNLILGGVDLLDQTPVIDIKPYLPYADIISDANGGYAQQAPTPPMTVSFSPMALTQCQQYQHQYPQLQCLIENLLRQDPRPAYKQKNPTLQTYGVNLYDLNVSWTVADNHSTVTSIYPIKK